jgi:hypothetical protein
MTITKALKASIDAGPFAGREDDLVKFFGTKRLAERFLADFTEARDDAIREAKRGSGRSEDCTFPEQFWDGRLFLGPEDLCDRGVDRQTLIDFVPAVRVEDTGLDCEIHLIRNGRERIIVVDWDWKEDEYAVDAWLVQKGN